MAVNIYSFKIFRAGPPWEGPPPSQTPGSGRVGNFCSLRTYWMCVRARCARLRPCYYFLFFFNSKRILSISQKLWQKYLMPITILAKRKKILLMAFHKLSYFLSVACKPFLYCTCKPTLNVINSFYTYYLTEYLIYYLTIACQYFKNFLCIT